MKVDVKRSTSSVERIEVSGADVEKIVRAALEIPETAVSEKLPVTLVFSSVVSEEATEDRDISDIKARGRV